MRHLVVSRNIRTLISVNPNGSFPMQILGSSLSLHSKFLIGVVVALLVTVVLATGFLILEGKFRTQPTKDLEETTEVRRVHESNSLRPRAQTQVEQESASMGLRTEPAFDRDASLFHEASLASLEELTRLLRQSANIDSKSDRLASQTIILRKITSINPQEALVQLELLNPFDSDSLVQAIFYEWSYSDFEGAVAEAAHLPPHQKNLVLKEILRGRDDLSELESIDIGRFLGVEDLLPEMTTETVVSQLVREDPKLAWEFAIGDDVNDFAQIDLLVRIAEEWKVRDGLSVLSPISKALAGYEKSGILVYVVGALSKSNHEEALSFAQHLPPESWSAVSGTIAGSWARSNPQAALSSVSQVGDGRLRNHLRQRVVQSWATSDPRGIVNALESIPKDLLQLGLTSAFRSIADQNLTEAIRLMQSMATSVGSTSSIARVIVDRWSDSDPEGALEWVDSLSAIDTFQKRVLVEEALSHLVHIDPKKALKFAQQHVAADRGFDIERKLIAELVVKQNVDVALAMLPLVSSLARLNCFKYVGSGLVRNDRPETALELANQLPKSEKESYLTVVAISWARSNPTTLIESMESLPSDDARAIAAAEVLRGNNREPILNAEEVKFLATFLNEIDSLSLDL